MYGWFDGAFLPEKRVASFGVVIRSREHHLLHASYGMVGEGDGMGNNAAEFAAAGVALLTIGAFDGPLELRGDSRAVIDFLDGFAPHRASAPWRDRALVLRRALAERVILKWVPRVQNHEANRLANAALIVAGFRTGKVLPLKGKLKANGYPGGFGTLREAFIKAGIILPAEVSPLHGQA